MASDRPPNSVEVTPTGIRIEYWDEVGVDGQPQRRRYKVNGEQVANVTSILGVLAKDALLDWAANLAFEGKRWRDVRNEAGRRGHGAHHILMQAMLGEGASLADLPEEHRAWGQAAFKWVRDRSPQVWDSERMVASLKWRYAGRLDLFAGISGAATLVDFKSVSKWSTRKSGERYPPYVENLLQLDLYQGARIECGLPRAERGLIVRLGPDATYDETFVDLDPTRGTGIIAAYRAKNMAADVLKAAAKAAHISREMDRQIALATEAVGV